MTTLADIVALLDGPKQVTLSIDGRETEVAFLNEECGFDQSFFLAGSEHGAHVLIHARSFEDAWETWVDERSTIPEDELIEAYGVVDRDDVTEAYIAGHGEAPKEYSTRPGSAWATWHDGLRLAQTWWLRNYDDQENPLDLVEGYEYQSNATGTGIVDMGHYAWMREVDPDEIGFVGVPREQEDAVITTAREAVRKASA